jgi:alpha-ketoglutarate-dependent 2,4-dichlorophenoxyacetate dioxygenase
MVWRNPANGHDALYLASHAYSIEGMGSMAGKTLIEELMAVATAPGMSYLHRWRQGDVAM